MIKKFRLWAIIVLISFVPAYCYLLIYVLNPPGSVFNGVGIDDINTLIAMLSVRNDFENPYAIEQDYTKIYHDVSFGPSIFFIMLGLVSYFTGLHPLIVFIAARVVGFALLLYFSYKLFYVFDKEKCSTMFFIYVFSFGLGWIFFIFGHFIGFNVGVFSFLNGYYVIPIAFSVMSFYFFIRKKYFKSSVALSFVALIHPFDFIGTLMIMLIYLVTHKSPIIALKGNKQIFSCWQYAKQAYNALVVYLLHYKKSGYIFVAIPFLGLLPYILLASGLYTLQYIAKERIMYGSGFPLISLLIGGSFAFVAAIYYTGIKRPLRIALLIITAALFTIGQLSQSFWTDRLLSLRAYSLFLEIPFIILFVYIAANTFLKEKNPTRRFLVLSFIATMLLTTIPGNLNPVMPYRLYPFLWLITSIIFPYAILHTPKNRQKIIKTAAIYLSIPSIFVMIYMYTFSLGMCSGCISNTSVEMRDLLLSLNSEPEGVVLAPSIVGTYLPLYTNQKTLLSTHATNLLNYTEKSDAYTRFMKNNDTSILEEYGIKYIISEENGKPVI